MSHPESEPFLPEANAKTPTPWVQLASRLVFKNRWIELYDDQVQGPGGVKTDYGVIRFHHRAVGIIAVDENENTILVGQQRYPLAYFSWEIPEGGSPPSEPLEVSARRELQEETGLTATQWNYLGCLALSNSVTDEVAHFFLARQLNQGTATPEANEVLETRWLPLSAACQQAMEGALNESLSVVGLLRARHFIENEKSGISPSHYSDTP